jgi:Acetyltransferase (GNAT) family
MIKCKKRIFKVQGKYRNVNTMDVQNLEHTDLELINELKPADWPDIVTPFTFYISSFFCFPVKVMNNGTIAGTGSVIIHNDVAWLAHIIVHPAHRGRGLGGLITQALVDISRKNNCTTIYLLATELGEPVYTKAGFVTETGYLFFKDIRPPADFTLPAGIIPYKEAYRDELARLDRQVSGEERMHHTAHYLNDGFLYRAGSITEGFYLPGFGEGLIIANTVNAGTALMKMRLLSKTNASFPVGNKEAAALLYQYNYREFRSAKRMRLGKERTWQPENIYSRIGGNLG